MGYYQQKRKEERQKGSQYKGVQKGKTWKLQCRKINLAKTFIQINKQDQNKVSSTNQNSGNGPGMSLMMLDSVNKNTLMSVDVSEKCPCSSKAFSD